MTNLEYDNLCLQIQKRLKNGPIWPFHKKVLAVLQIQWLRARQITKLKPVWDKSKACKRKKKKISLKFVHHLTRLILNMAWLLLLSSIIYYSSETQAVDIHAPPDIGSHLRHFEGADKNPQFLTFPVNESLDEDAVPCWNASACAYTIYPVLGCFLSEGLFLL